MALDPATRQVVLFGGNQCPSGDFLGDTWAWNGSRWQQLSSPTAPSPRSLFVLSRDADGHLLLFGGYKQQGPNEISDSQTWRLA